MKSIIKKYALRCPVLLEYELTVPERATVLKTIDVRGIEIIAEYVRSRRTSPGVEKARRREYLPDRDKEERELLETYLFHPNEHSLSKMQEAGLIIMREDIAAENNCKVQLWAVSDAVDCSLDVLPVLSDFGGLEEPLQAAGMFHAYHRTPDYVDYVRTRRRPGQRGRKPQIFRDRSLYRELVVGILRVARCWLRTSDIAEVLQYYVLVPFAEEPREGTQEEPAARRTCDE